MFKFNPHNIYDLLEKLDDMICFHEVFTFSEENFYSFYEAVNRDIDNVNEGFK